jgi:hypothetical protein
MSYSALDRKLNDYYLVLALVSSNVLGTTSVLNDFI